MKKLIGVLSVAAISLFSMTSCKKIIKALFPGIEVNLGQITLPLPKPPIPLPPGTELPPLTINQHFDLDSLVKANTANQFGVSDVSSVKVISMTITIVSGASPQNNLQNFENARFTIQSNSNSTPSDIASFNFPDTYSETATYSSENSAELISYLQGKELLYKVFVKIRKSPTDNMSIRVNTRVAAK